MFGAWHSTRGQLVAGLSGPPNLSESRHEAGFSAAVPGSGKIRFFGGPESLSGCIPRSLLRASGLLPCCPNTPQLAAGIFYFWLEAAVDKRFPRNRTARCLNNL